MVTQVTSGRVKKFEDLEVWQLGERLVLLAYKLTGSFPEEEKYGLSSQIRRAAISVPANIAEAFGRYHYRDRLQFLLNARGSLYELRSHYLVALELGFIPDGSSDFFEALIDELGIKLNNLINVTRRNSSLKA